jgi:HPt (histidine-containing phosphotransfer) domain-containing protein
MPEKLPVLDKNKALQIVAGKESLADELLAMLIKELPGYKDSTQRELDNGNKEELRKVIHKLHGGLRYVGAPALLDITSHTDQHLFDLSDEQLKDSIIQVHGEIGRLLEKEYYDDK